MRIIISRNKNSKWVQKSTGVFFCSMLVNAVNYLFQMCAGRMLTVEEFGRINALLSAFAIFSVPGAAMQMYASKQTAGLLAAARNKELVPFLYRAVPAAVGVFLLTGAVYVATYRQSDWPEWGYFLLLMALYDFLYVFMGIAQGYQSFYFMLLLVLFPAIFRLLGVFAAFPRNTGRIPVILGFLTAGAALGDTVGCTWLLHKGRNHRRIKRKSDAASMLKEMQETGKLCMAYIKDPIMLLHLGQAAMMNMDLLLVKRQFGDEAAGLYSSSMLIGRILVYAVSSLVTVLFPMAVTERGKGARSLYRKMVWMSAGMMAAAFVPVMLMPHMAVTVLVGEKYGSAQPYMFLSLWLAGMTGFQTLNLNYGVSQERTKGLTISFLLFCACAVGGAQYSFHSVIELLLFLAFLEGILFLWNAWNLQKTG